MSQLDEFVQGILDNGIAEKTKHAAEVAKLTKVIKTEKEKIEEEYTKLGELYYSIHADDSEGELGKVVSEIKASEKKIIDSKMKISDMLGFRFCEACGGQVDEDALYCNNCGHKMPTKVLPGMVLCKHCNKAVRAGIHFCTNCGKSMFEEVTVEEKAEEKADENVKTCPNCGFTTTDMTKNFCDDCGRRLEGGIPEEAAPEPEKVPTNKVCPNCGFKIFDAETMFCNDCGRRLVEEAELNK